MLELIITAASDTPVAVKKCSCMLPHWHFGLSSALKQHVVQGFSIMLATIAAASFWAVDII